MTDYEWECRERAKQRERFMVYRKNRSYNNLPEDPSNLGYDFIEDDDNERMKKFNFMTTVSIPVYDKRENAVSSEDCWFDDKVLEVIEASAEEKSEQSYWQFSKIPLKKFIEMKFKIWW